ncbi:type II restriction endonuclease [Lactobacillus mulieris]|uniref:Type-2 restriction enzyme n=1 Tax=Lactobacillus mulieris TaxID=2508708 RepID=A0AAW5WZ11_9LACO|nr:type II restriction endonuclease [Lactobacillus mulieris]MCZ3622452.1 type II restriction endonuclease [Lactobacillus mulieris]MCZ3624127.1 type II restriction endonuclease [Lactobacillus mulieris]MCZ3636459.1 type II restriction endonuclease [Lactobacillus mulieris]MCZ3690257.1 type II restriction endonuclease [Lactobacillus mulieris]MCZ3696097.1 type II restriction endonuclease [Lactobacillus mulieris]
MNLNEYLSMNNQDKFDYFMKTRTSTNRTPKYWVNWDKVIRDLKEHELNLNTLNYLVGKKNIRQEAKNLFISQPDLLKTIPVLLATRDSDLDVLAFDDIGRMYTYNINFHDIDISKIDKYINFIDETGLFDFLSQHVNRSLVDYVFGVEAGLDSNARKNRGGKQNEDILSHYLELMCKKDDELEYSTQATADAIMKRWNAYVPEILEKGRKGGRRYDGAVYNKATKKVLICETNFYGGGGSKLKAVSGEFSDLYATSLGPAKNVEFAWISDGPGWDTAKNPLFEAFQIIPNIFNLKMVQEGMLKELIKGEK